MRFKFLLGLHVLIYLTLALFSYGFVDANFPLKTIPALYNLVHFHRAATTLLYSIVVRISLPHFAFFSAIIIINNENPDCFIA